MNNTLEKIAQLIPAEYRKEILELNMIDSATAIAGNMNMHYLAVIWKNYIEPSFSPDCPLCYSRVLQNFRQLKSILVKMEQDANLLKSA